MVVTKVQTAAANALHIVESTFLDACLDPGSPHHPLASRYLVQSRLHQLLGSLVRSSVAAARFSKSAAPSLVAATDLLVSRGQLQILGTTAIGGSYAENELGNFAHSNQVIILDREGRISHVQEGLGNAPDNALVAIEKLRR